MITISAIRRVLLGALTAFALAAAGITAPVVPGTLTPAVAQVSDDFAAALEPYGRWIRHPRYGEVWVPNDVAPDWRPYEYGHWVYTDDWGWYWISDDSEDDWGWVVYHYGRWAFDRDIGWFWIPGNEWAPAWVDWRYGGDDIGWAPLPPGDVDYDYYVAQPTYWVFVPIRFIGEERLRRYYVPRDRLVVVLRDTRIINRPVHVEGRRIWVNPGLAPGFIAGRTHVNLHSYQVRPRVLSGTANVQGAVTVRREDLRQRGAVRRIAPVSVQRTNATIQPTSAPPPQPLNKNEPGRLGPHVPRAAQGAPVPPGGAQQQQQLREQQLRQQQQQQLQKQAPPAQVQPQQQNNQQRQLREQQLRNQQQQNQLQQQREQQLLRERQNQQQQQLREQQLRQQQQIEQQQKMQQQQQQLRQQQLQQQQHQQQQIQQQQQRQIQQHAPPPQQHAPPPPPQQHAPPPQPRQVAPPPQQHAPPPKQPQAQPRKPGQPGAPEERK